MTAPIYVKMKPNVYSMFSEDLIVFMALKKSYSKL